MHSALIIAYIIFINLGSVFVSLPLPPFNVSTLMLLFHHHLQHPHLPPVIEHDSWRPIVYPPLSSAYKSANGQEPDFTNYAKVRSILDLYAEIDLWSHPSLAMYSSSFEQLVTSLISTYCMIDTVL
jgi:hypothetical protein